MVVGSKNTSRECPECHHVEKRNRKSRDVFQCLNPECAYTEMADYVAARNIAGRAAVNQPIVAPLFSAVTKAVSDDVANRPPDLSGGI